MFLLVYFFEFNFEIISALVEIWKGQVCLKFLMDCISVHLVFLKMMVWNCAFKLLDVIHDVPPMVQIFDY